MNNFCSWSSDEQDDEHLNWDCGTSGDAGAEEDSRREVVERHVRLALRHSLIALLHGARLFLESNPDIDEERNEEGGAYE